MRSFRFANDFQINICIFSVYVRLRVYVCVESMEICPYVSRASESMIGLEFRIDFQSIFQFFSFFAYIWPFAAENYDSCRTLCSCLCVCVQL